MQQTHEVSTWGVGFLFTWEHKSDVNLGDLLHYRAQPNFSKSKSLTEFESQGWEASPSDVISHGKLWKSSEEKRTFDDETRAF